jgi:hypothetical protein
MLYSLKSLCYTQINIYNVSAIYSFIAEVPTAQIGSLEVGTAQFGTTEVGTAKIGAAEVNTLEAGKAEGKVGSGKPFPPLIPCLYSLHEQIEMFLVGHLVPSSLTC